MTTNLLMRSGAKLQTKPKDSTGVHPPSATTTASKDIEAQLDTGIQTETETETEPEIQTQTGQMTMRQVLAHITP